MKIRYHLLCAAALMSALLASKLTDAEDQQHGPFLTFENPSGVAATYNTAGKIDEDNPFFQRLGTNGRSCNTCHQASDGWTVIPLHIRDRFDATDGTDPIFRFDGANSPNADVSTVAARKAALQHAARPKALSASASVFPTNAEFELVGVDDPYGYASAQRAVAVPAAVAHDQPQVSQHRDGGRPRDIQGSRIDGLHFRYDDLFRINCLRSRRSVERRHRRTCAGRAAALAGPARSHRAIRDGVIYRTGVRFQCEVSWRARRAGGPLEASNSRSTSASMMSSRATTRRDRPSIRSCSPCTTPGPDCRRRHGGAARRVVEARRPWRAASCCSTPSRSRSRDVKGPE